MTFILCLYKIPQYNIGWVISLYELSFLFTFHFPYIYKRESVRKRMVGQWGKEVDEEVVIRCYDERRDRIQMDRVEKSCEIGHDHQTLLFTDTLGDPICRIRNSPLFIMLVNFSLSLYLYFS